MRSKIAGAAPLMNGLDSKGLPVEKLPKDPESIPASLVLKKLRQRRIRIRPRKSVAAAARRPKIILHVNKREPELPKITQWCQYNNASMAGNIRQSMQQAQVMCGVAAISLEERLPAREILLGMLPKLYTNFWFYH